MCVRVCEFVCCYKCSKRKTNEHINYLVSETKFKSSKTIRNLIIDKK